MSSMDIFFTLKPTLSPGMASGTEAWCISTDLTSVEATVGANWIIMPAFKIPVSTRLTKGTVLIPEILYTSTWERQPQPEKDPCTKAYW
jgi:hypothetical protein